MEVRKLIAPIILAGTGMMTPLAHAWNGPGISDGYGPSGSGMDSGFGFNMAFSARGRGQSRFGNRPVILRGVNFRFDSAELTPESAEALDLVADTLREHPEATLEVGGHASAEGDARYNLDLSRRRAKAVREHLVGQGIPEDKLTSNGYGEMRPVVANTTENGRSYNRRVELTPVYLAALRR